VPTIRVPGWAVEGIAVKLETDFTDGGRGRNPFFEMQYRALIRENKFYSWKKASYPSPFPPADRIYQAGYLIKRLLARTYGNDIFEKIYREFLGTSNPTLVWKAFSIRGPGSWKKPNRGFPPWVKKRRNISEFPREKKENLEGAQYNPGVFPRKRIPGVFGISPGGFRGKPPYIGPRNITEGGGGDFFLGGKTPPPKKKTSSQSQKKRVFFREEEKPP